MDTQEKKPPFFDREAVKSAVRAMHTANKNLETRRLFAIRVTGAAAHLAGAVTDIPGSSGTLYDARIVYHQASSMAAAGAYVEQATSREMAVALARNARRITATEANAWKAALQESLEEWEAKLPEIQRRATETGTDAAREALVHAQRRISSLKQLVSDPFPVVYGLGLTAAIATDRKRRGADIVFIALATETETFVVEAVFARDTWQRDDQDVVCQLLALNLMLESMGLSQVEIFQDYLPGKVYCLEKSYLRDEAYDYLPSKPFTLRPTPIQGEDVGPLNLTEAAIREHPLTTPEGYFAPMPPPEDITGGKPVCMICTSGNPFSESHRSMADEARQRGFFPIFAIERESHPDKGPIPIEELSRRIDEFHGREWVLVTEGLGYYADKAKTYPNTVFAIGMDVAHRLVSCAHERCLSDLVRLREHGATLLVFPREVNKRLETLADLVIPAGFEGLFVAASTTPPPGSSTDIRIALGIEEAKAA